MSPSNFIEKFSLSCKWTYSPITQCAVNVFELLSFLGDFFKDLQEEFQNWEASASSQAKPKSLWEELAVRNLPSHSSYTIVDCSLGIAFKANIRNTVHKQSQNLSNTFTLENLLMGSN